MSTGMITVLDVGGSSVKAGLVESRDDGLRPVGASTVTTLDHSASADVIIDRFAAAAHSVGVTDRLAVAIPEPFDYATGVSWMTHKFAALHGVDVVASLTQRLGDVPRIRCCNDAAAAVVGEAVAGAGAGYRRVLGVTLGTGLGAALVVDGQVVGEEGGIVVGDLYRRHLADGRSADDALSARTYHARREAKEPDVDATFGTDLAAFLRPVVTTVGADVVVVGGGGAASFPDFGPALRAGLAELAVPAEPATLGPWAPIVGAAEICFGSNA